MEVTIRRYTAADRTMDVKGFQLLPVARYFQAL